MSPWAQSRTKGIAMAEGILLMMALLMAGCATTAQQEAALSQQIDGCTVSGVAIAELDTATICQAVRRAFLDGGADEGLTIAIEIVSEFRADALVVDAAGVEIASLTLDAANTGLSEEAFGHFGADLSHMTRKHLDTAI